GREALRDERRDLMDRHPTTQAAVRLAAGAPAAELRVQGRLGEGGAPDVGTTRDFCPKRLSMKSNEKESIQSSAHVAVEQRKANSIGGPILAMVGAAGLEPATR
ncbi:MAG TPA: hypothetical protein VLV76_10890, partial [Candidatus Acidoferrum sp.]|nr:hypothetical protein [Candidatus Acidoferrum sp.]